MEKAIFGEGDCDHLSHLASYMKCNNLVKIITNYEFERRLSDAWTGSTNEDRRRSLWRGYESIALEISSVHDDATKVAERSPAGF